MRAVITGGYGFIGSNLANHLDSLGWEVSVIVRGHSIPCIKLNPTIRIISGSCYDTTILALFKDVDVCFHLATTHTPAASNYNIQDDVMTNLLGTVKLLDAAVTYKFGRVVYLSSGGTVYGANSNIPLLETDHGNPECSYGLVKKTIEGYLHLYNKLYGLEFNVIRLANAYGIGQRFGTGQGAINTFIHKILTKQTIEIWGDGSSIRDYVYIDDAVAAIALAGHTQITHTTFNECDYSVNRIFNVGSGKGTSLVDVIRLLQNEFDDDIHVKFMDARKVDIPANVLSVTAITNQYDWYPRTKLQSGIHLTAEWARTKLQG